jgi:hypothetical protein
MNSGKQPKKFNKDTLNSRIISLQMREVTTLNLLVASRIEAKEIFLIFTKALTKQSRELIALLWLEKKASSILDINMVVNAGWVTNLVNMAKLTMPNAK